MYVLLHTRCISTFSTPDLLHPSTYQCAAKEKPRGDLDHERKPGLVGTRANVSILFQNQNPRSTLLSYPRSQTREESHPVSLRPVSPAPTAHTERVHSTPVRGIQIKSEMAKKKKTIVPSFLSRNNPRPADPT